MIEVVFKDNAELAKKFKRLDDYFENITEADLNTQDIWDYLDFAEPYHKGLMQLFINNHLVSYLEKFNSEMGIIDSELSRASIAEKNLIDDYLKNKR